VKNGEVLGGYLQWVAGCFIVKTKTSSMFSEILQALGGRVLVDRDELLKIHAILDKKLRNAVGFAYGSDSVYPEEHHAMTVGERDLYSVRFSKDVHNGMYIIAVDLNDEIASKKDEDNLQTAFVKSVREILKKDEFDRFKAMRNAFAREKGGSAGHIHVEFDVNKGSMVLLKTIGTKQKNSETGKVMYSFELIVHRIPRKKGDGVEWQGRYVPDI
jgi:hypothetical protein